MGFFSDLWEGAKETASDTWDNIKRGDILAIGEDWLKGSVALMSGGTSNWLVDDIRNALDPTIDPLAMSSAQDRKVTHRTTVGPRELVYGNVKKGGMVAYIESSGANDKYLHLIVVLAAHPCDSIQTIYFGDKQVATGGLPDVDDSQLFSIEPDYTDKLLAFAQLGDQTQVYSEILSNTPDSWTVDHKLLGQTFLYLRLEYDRTLYRSGVPNISVIMVGKKDIYDPRDLSTGYSSNHALCVLDYLRWEHGMNVPDAEIDMPSFENAADISEEIVDTEYQWWGGGSTETRYLVDGVLMISRPPPKNLEELLRAGGANMSFYQGKWRIIPAKYAAPVLSFDESDLVGGIQFTPSASKSSRLNSVKGSYISPYDNWELTDYAQMQIAEN